MAGKGPEQDIAEALARVREEIAAAAARAGRRPEEIKLVAVSKNVPAEIVGLAAGLGLRVFGESRIQEAKAKMPFLPADIEWHMVGRLQTNKAKDAVRLFSLIHSVDRLELAQAISKTAAKAQSEQRVLIQINVAGAAQQGGVPLGETPEFIEKCSKLPYLRYCGLMAIGPYPATESEIRGAYGRVRELFGRLAASMGPEFGILSMGMSGDFGLAIEEGSTLVRIGTGIFGERRY